MHVPVRQRGPLRAALEGQFIAFLLALALPARPPARGWAPRRPPSTVTAILVIHGLPRRKQI